MRKAILASALLGAVSLSFATNGDNLIGVSPGVWVVANGCHFPFKSVKS
jgi:hypothetical protein